MNQSVTLQRQSSIQDLGVPSSGEKLNESGLQPIDPPKGKGTTAPSNLKKSPPSSFKSKDLVLSEKGRGRLQKTIEGRVAKKEKFENLPTEKTERDKVKAEKSKETQSKFQKFLKEFKSVFKNTGKLTKATGDGVKYLGGGDVTKVTGGIGAGAQLFETVSDIYLAKVKVDKAKTDLETVEKFSPEKLKQEEAELRKGREEVREVKRDAEKGVSSTNKQLKTLNKTATGLKKQIKTKEGEIETVKNRMDIIKSNIALARHNDVGTDFLKEELGRLGDRLNDLEGEKRVLGKQLHVCKGKISVREQRLELFQKQIEKCDELISKFDEAIKGNVSTGRMKGRVAEKDLNSYNDNVGLERAKLIKSLWDGQKALMDIGSISTVGTQVVSEGFKLAGGVTGVVVGPLTVAVNGYEFYNDVRDNRQFLALKEKSTQALKRDDVIKQDDVELLAIAERLRLKQKKQSVDKGLSATKNFFGALGGIGTATAGAVAIAVTAGAVSATAAGVLIATPVGWGLAGAAALAAIGYGIYKLARHLNSKGIKDALQTTLQNISGKDPGTKISDLNLEGKDAKAMKRVTDKMIKALKAQGITATASDFTVADVEAYASKKLLARDTGVATASLYHRFKEEVGGYFNQQGITDPTENDIEGYLNAKKDERPVSSAVGLMAALGLSLTKGEAIDMFRDGSSSDSVKFLTKKLKLA